MLGGSSDPGVSSTRMKKVRFDTSGAIAFQLKLGRDLPPGERKPMKLEGWLVDDHLCVRKTKNEGWCLTLYPWGDRITAGFFTKDDAVACAKEIHALDVPWSRMHNVDAISSSYVDHVMKVRAILEIYRADGLLEAERA
jgi:hypothetical protein